MPSLTSCTNHAKRPAVGVCPLCGKPFCEGCMSYRGGRYTCKGCTAVASAEKTLELDGSARRSRQGSAAAGGDGASAEQPDGQVVSRYKRKLAVQRTIRRVIIVAVLLVLVFLAYLPAVMNLALEQAIGDGMISKSHVPALLIGTAKVHILYGRSERAVTILEEAEKRLPPDEQALVYYFLGKANLRLEEFEKAREHMQTFLQRWPQHDRALEVGEDLKYAEGVIESRKLNRGLKSSSAERQR